MCIWCITFFGLLGVNFILWPVAAYQMGRTAGMQEIIRALERADK